MTMLKMFFSSKYATTRNETDSNIFYLDVCQMKKQYLTWSTFIVSRYPNIDTFRWWITCISYVYHIVRIPFTVYCSPLFEPLLLLTQNRFNINILYYSCAILVIDEYWWTFHSTLSSLPLYILLVPYQTRYWVTVFMRKTTNPNYLLL